MNAKFEARSDHFSLTFSASQMDCKILIDRSNLQRFGEFLKTGKEDNFSDYRSDWDTSYPDIFLSTLEDELKIIVPGFYSDGDDDFSIRLKMPFSSFVNVCSARVEELIAEDEAKKSERELAIKNQKEEMERRFSAAIAKFEEIDFQNLTVKFLRSKIPDRSFKKTGFKSELIENFKRWKEAIETRGIPNTDFINVLENW